MALLTKKPVFSLQLSLGRVNCSQAAAAMLDAKQVDTFRLLQRWQRGDWGEVDIIDPVFKKWIVINSKALATRSPQGRIVGIYPIGVEPAAGDPDSRERVWISGCPFAGKGANTTILLISEF